MGAMVLGGQESARRHPGGRCGSGSWSHRCSIPARLNVRLCLTRSDKEVQAANEHSGSLKEPPMPRLASLSPRARRGRGPRAPHARRESNGCSRVDSLLCDSNVTRQVPGPTLFHTCERRGLEAVGPWPGISYLGPKLGSKPSTLTPGSSNHVLRGLLLKLIVMSP